MASKYLGNLNNSSVVVDFSVSLEDKAHFDYYLAKVNVNS